MYAWAVESLPLATAARLIFVLRESQPEFRELRGDIETRYRAFSPEIVTVAELTRGQAETCLAAAPLLRADEPLCIHNADTAFDADPQWHLEALADGCDGALLVFESGELRWSYSREDEAGWVVEVQEKRVISRWASCGTYWFRRAADFLELAEAALEEHRSGEAYVAPLYNRLIAGGARIRNYRIRRLYCFGTPDDLAEAAPRLQEARATASPPDVPSVARR